MRAGFPTVCSMWDIHYSCGMLVAWPTRKRSPFGSETAGGLFFLLRSASD